MLMKDGEYFYEIMYIHINCYHACEQNQSKKNKTLYKTLIADNRINVDQAHNERW